MLSKLKQALILSAVDNLKTIYEEAIDEIEWLKSKLHHQKFTYTRAQILSIIASSMYSKRTGKKLFLNFHSDIRKLLT